MLDFNCLKMIPLAQPDIDASDISAAVDVLKSGQLSCGPKVDTFEKKIAEVVGAKYAVAVSSGTAALHLILRSQGIGSGDEVITTPYSFISSANCILFDGAKPVFADIDRKTYNIDPASVESCINSKTKGILGVNVFGRPAPWSLLSKLSDSRNLVLIEDACESLGTASTGINGVASAYGFYPNKQITCGEGGAITTNSSAIAEFARSTRNQGREPSGRGFHQLGFNYRLSDISCAILTSQLSRISSIVEARTNAVRMYNEALIDAPLRLPMAHESGGISWFVYIVELPEKIPTGFKDTLLQELSAEGIQAGPYFNPIHLEPFYTETFGYRKGQFPETEYVGDRTIALPFFPKITEAQVASVSTTLKKILERHRITKG